MFVYDMMNVQLYWSLGPRSRYDTRKEVADKIRNPIVIVCEGTTRPKCFSYQGTSPGVPQDLLQFPHEGKFSQLFQNVLRFDSFPRWL